MNEKIKPLADARGVLTTAMRQKLAELYKEIADKAIALYTPDIATKTFVCFEQYLEADNESRLGVCIGKLANGVDIAVTIRGMTRGGPFWGDFILTDGGGAGDAKGTCDGHQTLSVVELAPLLALATAASTALNAAFPAGAVSGTVTP